MRRTKQADPGQKISQLILFGQTHQRQGDFSQALTYYEQELTLVLERDGLSSVIDS